MASLLWFVGWIILVLGLAVVEVPNWFRVLCACLGVLVVALGLLVEAARDKLSR